MTPNQAQNVGGDWTLVIGPRRDWRDLGLRELWQYRDLVRLLVWRDIVAGHRQTILGPLWYVVQPLLTTLVYTVVFGNIAGLSTDGVPAFLFYLAGNTVWGYFSICLIRTSDTFATYAGMFGKVYFPRLVVPISMVLSTLASAGIRFALFIIVLVLFRLSGAAVHPTLWILALPVLVALMAGLGLGIGVIVSSLTTRYRDLQQLVNVGVQLFMFVTPIIYPLSTAQGRWRLALLANPMTSVVEVFRLAFLGSSVIEPTALLYTAVITLVVLVGGVLMFDRASTTFMDTV